MIFREAGTTSVLICGAEILWVEPNYGFVCVAVGEVDGNRVEREGG